MPRARRDLPAAIAAVFGLALLLLIVAPSLADAGTYTVYVCRTPTGGAAPLTDWRVAKGEFVSIDHAVEGCPAKPFELELDPEKTHPANDVLSATIEAPAGTEIEAYKFWRAVQVASKYAWGYRELTAFGDPEWDLCYGGQGCSGHGTTSQPFSSANIMTQTGRAGVTGLEFRLFCELPDSSAEKCPATSPGAKLELYGGELTMADNSAPVFSTPPSGPLVTPSQVLSGPEPVTISATDAGSGVYQAMLEVDGTVVQSATLDEDGGSCKPPYTRIAPCPPSATGSLTLDTESLADGTHSLRILVTDATGTNTAAWGPVSIQTDNGSCNPVPETNELDLTAGLVGRKNAKAKAITTRYGHRLHISGSLLAPDGQPVAGGAVCVAERLAAGAGALQSIATRVTNEKGVFSFTVPPGPSRRIYLIHRTTAGASVDSVAIRVRAPVSIEGRPRSLRNGQTLTMRGKLKSPPFPKRGALVELQSFRETGWQTFGTTNTNRRGRYSFRYTFSRTTGLAHYLLRARVPKQTDYPFESGHSKALKVTVRG